MQSAVASSSSPDIRSPSSVLQCGHRHTLSDYLGIGTSGPEDWSREDSASALRDALETLTLFHFIRKYHQEDEAMSETLFVKDGPLLLRAALSRLVVPIRDFIVHMKGNGHPLRLVGVEKTGNFAGFLEEYSMAILEPGDFFLPTVRFVVEEISGTVMAPATATGSRTGPRSASG